MYDRYTELSESTKEELPKVYKFYEELDVDNDYVNNIKTILKTKYVDASKIGLVVSAVGTKLRIENEQKEKLQLVKSEYVGEIGERITFKAVPECIFSSDSNFGWFYIYRMKVGNDELIWKTSKEIRTDVELEFTATIKSHEEFKGRKQTEVTRARTKIV